MQSMRSLETDLCHGFGRNWTSTDTLDEGYSGSTNIFAYLLLLTKMVILAKSFLYTATVVNGGIKS